MILGGAIVVAEHLFVYVAEQMKRLYRNVRALQSALQKAPEVFKAVGVNLAVHVPLRVVNRLVNEVLIVQSLIGKERISVDRALGCDMRPNFRLQMMLAARGDYVGVNLAATLQNTDYCRLVFNAALSDDALGRPECMNRAAPPMKVSSTSTS